MTSRCVLAIATGAADIAGGAGRATIAKQQDGMRAANATVRLMTVVPGHCHAGLVQKEMYPGVDKRVDVYAPLGPGLLEHLNRIASFNRRAERPSSWEREVHTGPA